MLTPLQVGQFRAMGFLKLEACLAPDEIAQFEAAYNRLIARGSVYDYSPRRREQVRALIRPFPYTDHLIETAGPRRRAMVARLRELAIA